MEKYPLFRKENLSAYFTIILTWFSVSAILGGFLAYISELSFIVGMGWAALSVMMGMSIMFGASVVNLRKLSPGFRRLANGEKNPQIPPVWCPVLTAATNAALELVEKKSDNSANEKIAN